jgi:hypothetical protein
MTPESVAPEHVEPQSPSAKAISTLLPWHLRRPARLLALWLALLAAGCVLLWGVGLALNDRYLWSQFLWWMPGWVVLPVAAVLLALSAWSQRLGMVPAFAQRRSARDRVALVVWVVVVGSGAWCGLVAWRLPQSIVRTPLPMQPPPGSVRLVHWNPSIFPRFDRLANDLSGLRPDIAALANPPISMGLGSVAAALPKGDGSPASCAIFGRLALFSRYPIVRWGATELRITGSRPRIFRWEGGGNISIDQGQLLLAELDTRAVLGTTIVVWLIDLPSDPDIPRMRMAREARETIAQFPGIMRERTVDGLDAAISDAGRERLLRPDVILGDCNIPRGSASLRELVGPGMRHAYQEAGAGMSLTFPRMPALLAIDNAFVGAGLMASEYRVVDVGAGKHRPQVLEVRGESSATR